MNGRKKFTGDGVALAELDRPIGAHVLLTEAGGHLEKPVEVLAELSGPLDDHEGERRVRVVDGESDPTVVLQGPALHSDASVLNWMAKDSGVPSTVNQTGDMLGRSGFGCVDDLLVALVDRLDDGVVVALVDGLADLLVRLGDCVVDAVEVQVVDDGHDGR